MEQNSEKSTSVYFLQFLSTIGEIDQSSYDAANRMFREQIFNAQYELLQSIITHGVGLDGINNDNIGYFAEEYFRKTYGDRN